MRLIYFPILVFLIFGCNKPVDNLSDSRNRPHTESTKAHYPHGKDFYKKHGMIYYTDSKTCLTCHSDNSSEGVAQVRCADCHDQYPHPPDWASAPQHASEFKKNSEKCIQCHGADLMGKNSRVSCNQCHKAYPHPSEWALPTGHGKAYLELSDKNGCFTCHDPGNENAGDVGFCDRCHTAFPHPSRFLHGAKARSYDGHCTSCHRDFKENMPKFGPRGGCNACHGKRILKIHWAEPQNAQAQPYQKNRKPSGSF